MRPVVDLDLYTLINEVVGRNPYHDLSQLRLYYMSEDGSSKLDTWDVSYSSFIFGEGGVVCFQSLPNGRVERLKDWAGCLKVLELRWAGPSRLQIKFCAWGGEI